MISFRYHIVTITAVFLALALGFVLGAAIRPTEQAVKSNVDRLTGEVSEKRAQIVDLRNQLQQTNGVVKNLSTRVVRGALIGRQVVYMDDGNAKSWQGRVRKAMSDATAKDVGTLTVTAKWMDPKSADDLNAIAAAGGIERGGDTGRAVIGALGDRLGGPEGAELVSALAKGGFLKTDAKIEGAWPPQGAVVVTLTAGLPTAEPALMAAAFARASAKVTPTLVVSGTAQDPGAVAALRDEAGGLPRLATFDSVGVDPAGAGSVLALSAAIDGRGGDFGLATGLPFLPPV